MEWRFKEEELLNKATNIQNGNSVTVYTNDDMEIETHVWWDPVQKILKMHVYINSVGYTLSRMNYCGCVPYNEKSVSSLVRFLNSGSRIDRNTLSYFLSHEINK